MPRHTLLSSRMITTFGLGHMRPASGTWGSLPPVVWAGMLILLTRLTPFGGAIWWVWNVSLWLTLIAFCWSVITGGDRAEAIYGPDPKEVVADETAAQCIPLLAMPPVLLSGPDLWRPMLAITLAFVLFRVFDIVKVWPASALQRISGAWGILLDDLVAGVYVAGVLWLVSLAW